MKRSLCLILMIAVIPVFLFGASRDVNRDGVSNQDDVRALGRMVAGLDPVDLQFDQNGDHALTLDDVNMLLDAIPPEENNGVVGSSTAAPPAQSSISKTVAFYALRQKATGRCVVVAGEEGISPGDTVLGAFPNFQQAQYEVVSRCDQRGDPGGGPLSTPIVSPSVEKIAPGILTITATSRGGVTKGVYCFDLRDGRGFYIDHFGKKAHEVRKRKLRRSIFEAVGRQAAASIGEILVGPICSQGGEFKAILVVETGTGKMGYLSGLDVDPLGGRPVAIAGRPASGLAGSSGGYALIMRRKGSGKTLGAYLYEASTGDCRIFRDIAGLPEDLHWAATSRLPSIAGPVSAYGLLNGAEETNRILLLDISGGVIYLISGVDRDPTKLRVHRLGSNLLTAFPRAQRQGGGLRFFPLAVNDNTGATKSVLIVDGGSGGLGILKGLKDPSKTRLIGIGRNIYDLAASGAGASGMLSGAPRIDESGRTKGAWIFDSSGPEIVYIKSLQDVSKLGIRQVVLH